MRVYAVISKALSVVFVVVQMSSLEAVVTEAQCRAFPLKNRHCHLEYGTWQRESNQVERYIYDWGAHKCVVWHWWTDPTRCSIPVNENNFGSNKECMDACSGWAK